MLTSIHPLGERARNSRWGLTATAYVVGSVLGGAATGAVLGMVGWGVRALTGYGTVAAAVVIAALGLAGAVFDSGLARMRLPTVRRQVDEDWLGRYRGWVYGVGFGFQLGMGVVTIVTTATVYVVLGLALVSALPVAGALIGASFGLARALPILTVSHVHDGATLRARQRRFHAVAPRWARVALVAEGATVVAGVAQLAARGGTWLG
jgi:sulfite exporter TauE/SafE